VQHLPLGRAKERLSGCAYWREGGDPLAGCVPGFAGYLETSTLTTAGLTGNPNRCTTDFGIVHHNTVGVMAADELICNALPGIE
jgi:hypothetical protein